MRFSSVRPKNAPLERSAHRSRIEDSRAPVSRIGSFMLEFLSVSTGNSGTRWFGRPRRGMLYTIDALRVSTPTGSDCELCGYEIRDGEDGIVDLESAALNTPTMTYHLECLA